MMPATPGKFEGEPFSTMALWELSMEGGMDGETGSVETGLWYGLFRGPVNAIEVLTMHGYKTTTLTVALNTGYTAVEILDSLIDLSRMVGAVLTEDDRGFVHADLYGVDPGTEREGMTPAETLERDWESYERCAEEASSDAE